jgi:hypothetical protein
MNEKDLTFMKWLNLKIKSDYSKHVHIAEA